MTDQHPITPPPELVKQWLREEYERGLTAEHVATQAARWGADQELEACCDWLQDPDLNVDTYKLRAARRPKPPSLKEQALKALTKIEDNGATYLDSSVIRRALEALPD